MIAPLRIIERTVNDKWEVCRMEHLNPDEKFRMFDPDGMPVNDGEIWVVKSHPEQIINENGTRTWSVDVNEK